MEGAGHQARRRRRSARACWVAWSWPAEVLRAEEEEEEAPEKNFVSIFWKLRAIFFYLDTQMIVRRRVKTAITKKMFLYSMLWKFVHTLKVWFILLPINLFICSSLFKEKWQVSILGRDFQIVFGQRGILELWLWVMLAQTFSLTYKIHFSCLPLNSSWWQKYLTNCVFAFIVGDNDFCEAQQ